MKPSHLRSLFLASTLLAAPLAAQSNVPQQDQAGLLNPAGPGPSPGGTGVGKNSDGEIPNAPVSPGDRDLGEQVILKETKRYEAFFFSAEASFNATSNVALVNRGAQSDVFFVGQVAAAWRPRIRENVAFDISISQAFFKYDRFPGFDFGSFNVGPGLSVNWKNLVWTVRYNYNILTDGSYQNEFFSQHSLIGSIQKNWSINSATAIYAGVSARKNWSDPAGPQRDEYTLYFGARAQLSRSFSLDVLYRAALHHYTFQDRNDFNQVLSLAARWSPRPWIAATVSVTLASNSSEVKAFDYRAANGGLALGLAIKF